MYSVYRRTMKLKPNIHAKESTDEKLKKGQRINLNVTKRKGSTSKAVKLAAP